MSSKRVTNYIFDSTLEGLLTAVFERFERKPNFVSLKTIQTFQPDAFAEEYQVITNREKADRVWKGILKRLDKVWVRKFYCAYLSEIPEIFDSLFHFATYIFQNPSGAEFNYGNTYVLAISKIATKVEREKHRMEAFIRFQHTADGIFYCGIEPDFNVIPLIAKHFKDRYADQQWVIYDLRRRYGIHYNLREVEEIVMDLNLNDFNTANASQLNQKEKLYAALWTAYFKSTNIESRKNTKLHVQHVPKRYWRYLTEKQP